MSSVIYEDKPPYDIRMRFIVMLPVIIMFASGLFIMDQDIETASMLFITALVMGFILWGILPRKYIIMNDKLTIALNGGPGISISLRNITAARMARGMTFSANFPTTLSGQSAVQIIRRKGMSIVITPGDPPRFLTTINSMLTGQGPNEKGVL